MSQKATLRIRPKTFLLSAQTLLLDRQVKPVVSPVLPSQRALGKVSRDGE